MDKKTENNNTVIFLMELILASAILLIGIFGNIPTNVLNSNVFLIIFGSFAVTALFLVFIMGIPLGIIGLVKQRKMKKFRVATIILSIINLTTSGIFWGFIIMLFVGVISGSLSV